MLSGPVPRKAGDVPQIPVEQGHAHAPFGPRIAGRVSNQTKN